MAEALDNLAACTSPPSMDLLVQGGMLPCLTMLLRGDALAVQATCATALANAAFAKDAIFAAFVEGGDNSPLTDFSNALLAPTSSSRTRRWTRLLPNDLGADVVGACDAALVGGLLCGSRVDVHMIRRQAPKCKRRSPSGPRDHQDLSRPDYSRDEGHVVTRLLTTLCNVSSDEDDERRLQLVEDGIVTALGRPRLAAPRTCKMI